MWPSIPQKNAFPIAADQCFEINSDTELAVTLSGFNLSGNEEWRIHDFPRHGTLTDTVPNLRYTPEIGYEGEDSFTYSVSDDNSTSAQARVSLRIKPVNPFMISGAVMASTGVWTNVRLPRSFVSMVAVCTPVYDPASCPPLIVRMQNAFGNEFQIKLSRADNSNEVIEDIPVQYIVIEEGTYSKDSHGATVEARRYTSSTFSGRANLTAQQYRNDYVNPVVIGQVLTTNNTSFQVFWASGDKPDQPPTPQTLFTGRHLGEDTNSQRCPEEIGYIVFESGAGSLAGLAFEAGVTSQSITHNPTRQAVTSINPDVAILSCAGMLGNNGCFPILADVTRSQSGFKLALNEDFFQDHERSHTTERVAYIALKSSPSSTPFALSKSASIVVHPNSVPPSYKIDLSALSIGNATAWSVIDSPLQGTLEGTVPALYYTPKSEFEGTDRFTFMASGSRGDSNIAEVSINVSAEDMNRPPVLEAVWAGPDPDKLLDKAILEVTAWDPDDDALTHSWECIDGPGKVTFGSHHYSPEHAHDSPVGSNAQTKASFSQPGRYTLKVTTSDTHNLSNVSYLSVNIASATGLSSNHGIVNAAIISKSGRLKSYLIVALLASIATLLIVCWVRRPKHVS